MFSILHSTPGVQHNFVGEALFQLQDIHTVQFCKLSARIQLTQLFLVSAPSELDPWRPGQRTEHVSYRDQGRSADGSSSLGQLHEMESLHMTNEMDFFLK